MKIIKFDLPINEKKIRSLEELRDNVSIELLSHLKSGLLKKWLYSRGLQEQALKVEVIVFDDDDEKLLFELCTALDIDIDRNSIATLIAQEKVAQQHIQFEDIKHVDDELKELLHLGNLSQKEINCIRDKSGKKVQQILRELESNVPGITEGFGAITGVGVGGAASFAALSGLGVSGLSAAGITSGLAAAGSLVGGGMVAGIGVLAAPVAILGIAGYAIFKHQKVKKQVAALQYAIGELFSVLEELIMNAQFFQEEIAGIKTIMDTLKARMPT